MKDRPSCACVWVWWKRVTDQLNNIFFSPFFTCVFLCIIVPNSLWLDSCNLFDLLCFFIFLSFFFYFLHFFFNLQLKKSQHTASSSFRTMSRSRRLWFKANYANCRGFMSYTAFNWRLPRGPELCDARTAARTNIKVHVVVLGKGREEEMHNKTN